MLRRSVHATLMLAAVNADPCDFPMTYDGVTYNTCTDVGEDYDWCYTKSGRRLGAEERKLRSYRQCSPTDYACEDQDDEIVKAAKKDGHDDVTGCADVKEYCSHPEHGKTVRRFCAKTCGTFGCYKWPEHWECPADWASSDAGKNDPHAQEFAAINNVFRCMHDAPNVQWDHDVYTSAAGFVKDDPQHHSKSETSERNGLTGENLAWQSGPYEHPLYNAAHRWYAEIVDPCEGKASCYQAGTRDGTGHFTASVWSGVRYIAGAASDSGKTVVGRYTCDTHTPSPKCVWPAELGYTSNAADMPNMGAAEGYKNYVWKYKNSYASCVAKVEACPAFSGYKIPTDKVNSCTDADKDCVAMYDTIEKFDGMIPSMFTQASLAPMVGCTLIASVLVGFMLVVRRRLARQPTIEGAVSVPMTGETELEPLE